MEKRVIIIFLLTIFFVPERYAIAESKPVIQTRLEYHLVVNETLDYEVNKRIEVIEHRIDSLKSKIK